MKEQQDLFIVHEGVSYARVSSILKAFTDFAQIPLQVLNQKAITGSLVHQAIAEEIEGGMPILSSEHNGYFQSFEKWRSVANPTFVDTERRYYCKDAMITGMVDAIITMQNVRESILVDWKTSVKEAATWVLQSHLYQYLLASAGKPVHPIALFIKLDKNGQLPTVFRYKFDERTMEKCFKAIGDFWKDHQKR